MPKKERTQKFFVRKHLPSYWSVWFGKDKKKKENAKYHNDYHANTSVQAQQGSVRGFDPPYESPPEFGTCPKVFGVCECMEGLTYFADGGFPPQSREYSDSRPNLANVGFMPQSREYSDSRPNPALRGMNLPPPGNDFPPPGSGFGPASYGSRGFPPGMPGGSQGMHLPGQSRGMGFSTPQSSHGTQSPYG